METVTLARNAMATRFEIVLHGERSVALRAAGEEALDEIDRLENRLSLYRPDSDIARVNARAAKTPVRVTPEVFSLLKRAQRLHAETDGAFDVTVAPLVRCWGFMGGTGKFPKPESVAAALNLVGMHRVNLNEADFTVRFEREGVMIDLGAIGKGYAVERAAEILREAGVESALLHGGTSTVEAIGRPPETDGWRVALPHPVRPGEVESASVTTVVLKNEAVSVSAVWGRSFEQSGKAYGHVLDPRTGQPVSHALMAVVVLPSATDTDALSTALLTLGSAGLKPLTGARPAMRSLLMTGSIESISIESRGIAVS